jgi:hypothetical protein
MSSYVFLAIAVLILVVVNGNESKNIHNEQVTANETESARLFFFV